MTTEPIPAPIFQSLCQVRSEKLSFHTPGHKQGQRGAALLTEWLPDAVGFDLTEIADLDSIRQPDGPLLQAERLTAELYGAKSTFFTTNGSTAGLIASLLCAAPYGSELLLPRNAHLATLSAIVLGDLLPRFVQPEWLDGHLLGITPGQLSQALDRHEGAKTVLLVSPSYQGVVGELELLVQTAQAAGRLVVVDEAHGAHLPFHPQLPLSAVACAADLVVQSAHKTLSALTGGAWVHRMTDRIEDERVRSCLNLVQSTSPSWLVLGSLDLARLELAQAGRDKLEQVLQNAGYLRRLIEAAGWSVWDVPVATGFRQDPMKINLLSHSCGFTGAELARELQQRGIYPEMIQANGVLLLLGLGDIDRDYALLAQCLQELPRRTALQPIMPAPLSLPELRLRPREAYFANVRWVSLTRAADRVAARPLYLYPPGIPLVYPGEVFSREATSIARHIHEFGGNLSGSKGDCVAVVE